jgi:DNA ligase-1
MIPYLLPLIFVFVLFLPTAIHAAQVAPPLMLAKVAHADLVYSDYLMSEKFDGVRAFWDGQQFITRSGRQITPPLWFIEQLPATEFEGEIWLGRQRFAEVSALVRRQDPEDPLWSEVVLMIFDLPGHPGSFVQRVTAINSMVAEIDQGWIKAVERFEISDSESAQEHLSRIVANGGEGLMLNDKHGLYTAKRTDSILKLKPRFDDEAIVVGYTSGKGKYEGQVGALIVEWQNGRQFKIGSGLSDQERIEPPEIGSKITFEFSGYTSTGLPRFARFLRVYHSL